MAFQPYDHKKELSKPERFVGGHRLPHQHGHAAYRGDAMALSHLQKAGPSRVVDGVKDTAAGFDDLLLGRHGVGFGIHTNRSGVAQQIKAPLLTDQGEEFIHQTDSDLCVGTQRADVCRQGLSPGHTAHPDGHHHIAAAEAGFNGHHPAGAAGS